MAKQIAAIIFHAPLGESAAERVVERGRRAAALDLISSLKATDMARIVVVSASGESQRVFDQSDVIVFPSSGDEPFHFGDTLRTLIRQEHLDGVLYFGSGSGGLLSPFQLARLLAFIRNTPFGALFNNFYSCDFAAIADAQRLVDLELPPVDNPLGFALSDAGFPCYALPRNAASQFDIDTPTDLLLLAITGSGGRHVQRFLHSTTLTHPHIGSVLQLLTQRSAHVLLLGRVNPRTWADFEQAVACRTSGLVEGRGMRAAAFAADPFIHQTIQACEAEEFFRRLAKAGNAAIIDTRPLLAQSSVLPDPGVRFASDLLDPEGMTNPQWQAFTRAAMQASIPVVLGGHSLVSGGLYLLAEASWKGKHLPRRLHPDLFDWEKEPA